MGPTSNVAFRALLLGTVGAWLWHRPAGIIAARLIIIVGTQAPAGPASVRASARPAAERHPGRRASAAAHSGSATGRTGDPAHPYGSATYCSAPPCCTRRRPPRRPPQGGTIGAEPRPAGHLRRAGAARPGPMVLLRTAWGSNNLDQFQRRARPGRPPAAAIFRTADHPAVPDRHGGQRGGPTDLDRQAAALERSPPGRCSRRGKRFPGDVRGPRPTGMAQLNHHGRRCWAANSALADFLGRTRAGLVGTRLASFVPPRGRGRAARAAGRGRLRGPGRRAVPARCAATTWRAGSCGPTW